jgi:hypothetical protein
VTLTPVFIDPCKYIRRQVGLQMVLVESSSTLLKFFMVSAAVKFNYFDSPGARFFSRISSPAIKPKSSGVNGCSAIKKTRKKKSNIIEMKALVLNMTCTDS